MILERGGRERERGEKHGQVASHMHPDSCSNLQPDREPNLRILGVWDDSPTNQATQPGLYWNTLNSLSLSPRAWKTINKSWHSHGTAPLHPRGERACPRGELSLLSLCGQCCLTSGLMLAVSRPPRCRELEEFSICCV